MSTEITHDTAHDEHDHHGPAKGLMRWVTTTNHKDIGTLYLWLSFIMLLRCDHAGIRWPGELAGADDDRRARYGVAAHE
jgi:glutamate dehydrogenase/leucine dehydrogenase